MTLFISLYGYLYLASGFLLPPLLFSMMVWCPVLCIYSRRRGFVKRVQACLSIFTMFFASVLTVGYVLRALQTSFAVYLLLLLIFMAAMICLFVLKRHTTWWGAAIFVALGAGVACFERIVVFLSGFGRDYLPGSWRYEDSGFPEMFIALSAGTLVVACGFAALWMPHPGHVTSLKESQD